jgi:hypothetical protein
LGGEEEGKPAPTERKSKKDKKAAAAGDATGDKKKKKTKAVKGAAAAAAAVAATAGGDEEGAYETVPDADGAGEAEAAVPVGVRVLATDEYVRIALESAVDTGAGTNPAAALLVDNISAGAVRVCAGLLRGGTHTHTAHTLCVCVCVCVCAFVYFSLSLCAIDRVECGSVVPGDGQCAAGGGRCHGRRCPLCRAGGAGGTSALARAPGCRRHLRPHLSAYNPHLQRHHGPCTGPLLVCVRVYCGVCLCLSVCVGGRCGRG